MLESDPPRRLSCTWRTFAPEWAQSVGIDEGARTRITAEPRPRVTFSLEPDGPLVKLTMVHAGFDPGSAVAACARISPQTATVPTSRSTRSAGESTMTGSA